MIIWSQKITLLKKSIYLIFFFLPQFVASQNWDAEQYNWQRTREISMNMTTLISDLVPFNLSSSAQQRTNFIYRTYGMKRALKIDLGFNLNEDSDEEKFNFRIGFDKIRKLSKRFYFTSGWQAVLRINSDENFGEPLVGISKCYGIKYLVSRNFHLYTQTTIDLLFAGGVHFETTLPLSIYAIVSIPRKQHLSSIEFQN